MQTIYIVEDDRNIREIEMLALKNSGYRVQGFGTAKEFYAALTDKLPTLVMLDIMLPDEDGITILQNLTAFQLLQQSNINQDTDRNRRSLLKLVGYTARENRSAELLLQAPGGGEGRTLPAQYKLWAGDICFETEGPVALRPWRLDGVYCAEGDAWREVTYLLDRSVPSAVQPFGPRPAPGSALCLMLEYAFFPPAQ